jgi:hypothetical protein
LLSFLAILLSLTSMAVQSLCAEKKQPKPQTAGDGGFFLTTKKLSP